MTKKIYKYDLDIEALAPLVETLDNTELGIYMRLEWYYIRVGFLPADKKDIFSITRAKNNKLQAAVERVLAKFYSPFGSERLDVERARITKQKIDNSEAGKVSAQRRIKNEFCAESKSDSGNLTNQLKNKDSPSTVVQPTTTTTIEEREIDKSISQKKLKKREVDWRQDQNFIRFWEAYPKRPGSSPSAAYKPYFSLIKSGDANHEQLLQGAQTYAKHRENQDAQYTKLASNWLSASFRGWEIDWESYPTPGNIKVAAVPAAPRALFTDYLHSLRQPAGEGDGGNFGDMRLVN